jgi:hypothetical protein
MSPAHRVALAERLAALAALDGVAVVWQPAHPNQSAPLLILRLVSDRRGICHAGDDGMREARIQADSYAGTDAVAQAIREAVIDDLHGLADELTEDGPRFDSCAHDNSFDDRDEASGLIRAACEFLIQYPPFSAP